MYHPSHVNFDKINIHWLIKSFVKMWQQHLQFNQINQHWNLKTCFSLLLQISITLFFTPVIYFHLTV